MYYLSQDELSKTSAVNPPEHEAEAETTNKVKSKAAEVTTTPFTEQYVGQQFSSGASPKNNSAYF